METDHKLTASAAQPADAAVDDAGIVVPDNVRVCLRSFDRFSVEELYLMLRLRSKVFVLEQRCLYEDIDGADQNAMHVLVWQRHKLLGYGRLLPADSNQPCVRIGRIIVASAWRGAGYSRWLIGLLRACAAQLWPDTCIKLSAQTHLQGLYQSCGFSACGQAYDEDGISHIDMRWHARV